MESSLLCSSSRFVSSQSKKSDFDKVGVVGRNFKSSFCGNVVLYMKNSRYPMNLGTASRSRALISSVMGSKVKKETIIPDPDYRIPVVLLGTAGAFVYADNLLAAVPIGLLGLLLLVQTTRVRFVFDGEALEVKVGDELKESGENAFVGGKNRWNSHDLIKV
ncbi:hypothetical protein ACJIZ3_024422 [Penstemon smallii]|uniref:Uncharacterized protein n=1 Tax=Penstemon smallii TaxID=265156 RepID=A0ABD3TT38_9LAMI